MSKPVTVRYWAAARALAQAPDLLPAQRSQLLQNLKPVVDALGAPEPGALLEVLPPFAGG